VSRALALTTVVLALLLATPHIDTQAQDQVEVTIRWVTYVDPTKGNDLAYGACVFGDYIAVVGAAGFNPLVVLLRKGDGGVVKKWIGSEWEVIFDCISVGGKLYAIGVTSATTIAIEVGFIYVFDVNLNILAKVMSEIPSASGYRSIAYDGKALYLGGWAYEDVDRDGKGERVWLVEKRALDARLSLVSSKKIYFGSWDEGWMHDMGVDPSTGRIWAVGYYSDSNYKLHSLIVILDSDLREFKVIDYTVDSEGHLGQLTGIAFDGRYAYVSGDYGVARFSVDGELVAINRDVWGRDEIVYYNNYLYIFGRDYIGGYWRHVLDIYDTDLNLVKRYVLSGGVNANSNFYIGGLVLEGNNVYVVGYDYAPGREDSRVIVYSLTLEGDTVEGSILTTQILTKAHRLVVEVRDVLLRTPVDVGVAVIRVDDTAYRVSLDKVGEGVYEGYLEEGRYRVLVDGVVVIDSLSVEGDVTLEVSWVSGTTRNLLLALYAVALLLVLVSPFTRGRWLPLAGHISIGILLLLLATLLPRMTPAIMLAGIAYVATLNAALLIPLISIPLTLILKTRVETEVGLEKTGVKVEKAEAAGELGEHKTVAEGLVRPERVEAKVEKATPLLKTRVETGVRLEKAEITGELVVRLLSRRVGGLVGGYGCLEGYRPRVVSLPIGVAPEGFDGLWSCCLLGCGGWGCAYRCERGGEVVVFKVPRGFEPIMEGGFIPTVSEKVLKRVVEEAGTIMALRHPNILRLYAASRKAPMLVYEYADYGSLEWQIARGWKPSLEDVLIVAVQVGDALRYIHSRGLLHGDIKAGNIFIAGGIAKLGDFSSLTRLLATTSSHSRLVYTPGWRAPEQVYADIRRKAEERGLEQRIDVYQLGNLILYMLTGETLDGEDAVKKGKVEEVVGKVELRELRELLAAMLNPDPLARISSEEAVKRLVEIYRSVSQTTVLS